MLNKRTLYTGSFVLTCASLTGCSALVKSMYDGDHPVGRASNAVVLYMVDNPKAIKAAKNALGEDVYNIMPPGKVMMQTYDRYGGWTYNSIMFGWSDPGTVDLGDIVRLTNRGVNIPSPVEAVVTKWNDVRPSGCFMRGNLLKRWDDGMVVCEDSSDAVPYRLKTRLDALYSARELAYMQKDQANKLLAEALSLAKSQGLTCSFSGWGGSKSAGYWCKPAAAGK